MQLCVRQLLFVAMVHDASASMGMMARRLLPQIEQGAKRRLLVGNMDGGSQYSAECLAACPAVQDMQTQIDKKKMTLMAASMRGAQSTSGGKPDMSAMGDMIADAAAASIGVMCEHKPAMMCLAEHAEVCSGTTVDMEKQLLMESFDCMCSSCPCMQTAVADMMSLLMQTFASLGEEQDNTQMMAAACKMAPAFACAQRETATCGRLLSSNASNSGESNMLSLSMFAGHGTNSSDSDMLEQDPVDLAQMCAGLGHTVDVNTCTGPGDEEQTSGAFAPGLMLIMFAGLVRVA